MKRLVTSLVVFAFLFGLFGQTSSVFASPMNSQMGMEYSRGCLTQGCLSLPQACTNHCFDQKNEHTVDVVPLPIKTILAIPEDPRPIIAPENRGVFTAQTNTYRDTKRILKVVKRE